MSSSMVRISHRAMMHVHETPAFDSESLVGLLPTDADLEEAALTLSRAAQDYAFQRRRNTRDSEASVALAMKELATDLRDALRVCGIYDDVNPVQSGAIYESVGPGVLFAAAAVDGEPSGEEAVIAALEGVRKLKRWAATAYQRSSTRAFVTPTPRGAPAAYDFDRFMKRVVGVYDRHSGDIARIGQDTLREPCGPFFDLLSFAANRLAELGLSKLLEPATLAKRWHRYVNRRTLIPN